MYGVWVWVYTMIFRENTVHNFEKPERVRLKRKLSKAFCLYGMSQTCNVCTLKLFGDFQKFLILIKLPIQQATAHTCKIPFRTLPLNDQWKYTSKPLTHFFKKMFSFFHSPPTSSKRDARFLLFSTINPQVSVWGKERTHTQSLMASTKDMYDDYQ